MKKTFTILILFLLPVIAALSQNYEQAAGLRLGSAGGITYRRMLGSNLAGEAMLLGQNNGTAAVFLFEKQKPAVLFDDLNLTFIYGIGAHIGAANNNDNCNDYYDRNSHYRGYNTLQLGFDGFASFEYLIPRYPVALSLECKPYFEFFDDHWLGLHIPVIAIGARYTF
jgi:hypothetical protein